MSIRIVSKLLFSSQANFRLPCVGLELPGYKKTLYTLDNRVHSIGNVEAFLVKALNNQLTNRIEEVHRELSFISENKK